MRVIRLDEKQSTGFFQVLELAPTTSEALKMAMSRFRDNHCQNGVADVCLAGRKDGVVCPEDSCDIDDGIRKG